MRIGSPEQHLVCCHKSLAFRQAAIPFDKSTVPNTTNEDLVHRELSHCGSWNGCLLNNRSADIACGFD
jgi:hypothetical protein